MWQPGQHLSYHFFPLEKTLSRLLTRVPKMRSCNELSGCSEHELIRPSRDSGNGLAERENSGTNPGDLAERVISGTNPRDLVERVSSGINLEDLAERVNSGTNPRDLVERVSSGTNLGDLAERVNLGTNPEDLAERVASGTNHGDLAERVNSGTKPRDLAERMNSGTNPGDLAERGLALSHYYHYFCSLLLHMYFIITFPASQCSQRGFTFNAVMHFTHWVVLGWRFALPREAEMTLLDPINFLRPG
ncbi:hypothetical protein B296_00045170 [Ensete ventricosum]|uniref:Uncharacterized protein n=1 Tax=Ensete ventricosum TaxID=4639 RepID=A0A426XGT5_ENSVE|nr:hypothetical protein B296_00045170 [Ensete ventricosum]